MKGVTFPGSTVHVNPIFSVLVPTTKNHPWENGGYSTGGMGRISMEASGVEDWTGILLQKQDCGRRLNQ